MGSFEHGNEPSISIKCFEFLEELNVLYSLRILFHVVGYRSSIRKLSSRHNVCNTPLNKGKVEVSP
jgi:hypothetical protein